MRAAVEVLADMAVRDWPNTVPVRGSSSYKLAKYDLDAMLIEVDLSAFLVLALAQEI